ncbi:uncharacterized protein LOC136026844 [Artemia franciscana]|uniref:uncharacterized protein LOC136026844 n=1 Tax=Artemia franciscana TaxID=6661 RepID=UPI0032DAEA96
MKTICLALALLVAAASAAPQKIIVRRQTQNVKPAAAPVDKKTIAQPVADVVPIDTKEVSKPIANVGAIDKQTVTKPVADVAKAGGAEELEERFVNSGVRRPVVQTQSHTSSMSIQKGGVSRPLAGGLGGVQSSFGQTGVGLGRPGSTQTGLGQTGLGQTGLGQTGLGQTGLGQTGFKQTSSLSQSTLSRPIAARPIGK